jgi:hypothetical protein
MKSILLTLLSFFYSYIVVGQLYMESTISTGTDESARYVDVLNDGNYIIAGIHTASGQSHSDFLIIKLSSAGELIWSKRIASSGEDILYNVKAASDGGFVMIGTTVGYGAAQRDILVIKADADGIVEWSVLIGGAQFDLSYTIVPTLDGGYLIDGTLQQSGTLFKLITVKLNSSGVVQWKKATGTAGIIGGGAIELSNGGFVVVGSIKESDYNLYLSKIGLEGDIIWEKSIPGNVNGSSYDINATDDGGFICFGETHETIGSDDVWIVKFNSSGEVEWSKVYGSSNRTTRTYGGEPISNGYVVAIHDYGTGSNNVGLLMIDLDGNVTSYFESDLATQAWGIHVSDQGSFIVGRKDVGGQDDVYLLKTDLLGQIGPQCAIPETTIQVEDWPCESTAVFSDQNSSVSVTNVTTTSVNIAMAMEFDCKHTVSVDNLSDLNRENISAKIFNSTSGNPNRLLLECEMGTTVSICIFNTAGERIVDRRSQKLNSGANWMDLPALSSGMYAIQILNGDSAIGVKLMVE